MSFAPCDKHIKSSSQDKASLLAAVVSTGCQEEPEDKTTVKKNRSKTSSTKARGQQEVEEEEPWIKFKSWKAATVFWSLNFAFCHALSPRTQAQDGLNEPKTAETVAPKPEMQILSQLRKQRLNLCL